MAVLVVLDLTGHVLMGLAVAVAVLQTCPARARLAVLEVYTEAVERLVLVAPPVSVRRRPALRARSASRRYLGC
jgi:hypothetical protein